MRKNGFPFALLLAAMAAPLAAPVRAGDDSPQRAGKPRPAPVKAHATKAPPPAIAAGMRAYIDPATGELREPTAEEAKALAKASAERARSAKRELTAFDHPNGMTSVDLQDAFLMDLAVRRNPDGTLSIVCAPRSGKIPAPALEEK